MKTLKSMLVVSAIVLLTGIPGSFIIAGLVWFFTGVLFGLEEPTLLATWKLLYVGLVGGIVVSVLVRWAVTAVTSATYAKKIGVSFHEVVEATQLGFTKHPGWNGYDKEEFQKWLVMARFVSTCDMYDAYMERYL